jgi:hypothetical protein
MNQQIISRLGMMVVIIIMIIIMYYMYYTVPFITKQKEYKLIVLAIFKNETMNLEMWIQHYLWQGCDKIYLVDNGSTDDPMPILQPYMDSGLVVYCSRPQKHQQMANLHHVIREKKLLEKTEWLLICDLDEFFYSPSGNLVSTLDSFKKYDIIYCNWLMFGSDGYKENHPTDIRTALIHRVPDLHTLTKYIVKTLAVKNVEHLNVHSVHHVGHATTENDKIRLNHYPIQSWKYFRNVKMQRGDATTQKNVRDENYFKRYDQNTNVKDTTLRDLVLQHKKEYSNSLKHTWFQEQG